MTNNRLPARFECPGCLYDLGAAESRRCPECGRDVTEGDIGAFHARAGAGVRVRELLLKHVLILGAVCGVMAIGAGIVARSVTAVFEAGGACGAAVAGSLLAGWVASRAGRRTDREGYFLIWVRTYLWLQIGWLCIPLCAIVILGAVFAFPPDHNMQPTLVSFAVVGFMLWLVAQILGAMGWMVQFNRARAGMGLGLWRAKGAFAVAAMIVLIGSFVLGLMGGIAALDAAETLARKNPWAAP